MRHRLTILLASFLLLLGAPFANAQINVQTFEGIDASTDPSAELTVDPNGAIGTKQYLEWVDTAYQGYDKTTFAGVYSSPLRADTPWVQNNMPDCKGNGGNGVILFDHLASRWIVGVRQTNSDYFYCIAVSNTDDLTSGSFAWYTYELDLNPLLGRNRRGHAYFPDYPRLATWSDGYYMSTDLMDPDRKYQIVGVMVCAFDRTNMLTGGTARTPQCFRYPKPPGNVFFRAHSLLPADIEGVNPPPDGTPEYYVSVQTPVSSDSDTLNRWKLAINWTKPAASRFQGPIRFEVPAYTPGCFNPLHPWATVCVPEPGSYYVDSIGDRVMHRFAYRRANSNDSYLISQTVQVGSGKLSQTGIRWYELGTGGTLVNSGTINPGDANYRFVPSVAQDKAGNLAVGYSVSGTALYPSISASYLNLSSGSKPTEFSIQPGSADEENSYHWGGYTSMTVDPVDDCTFWYVNEYFTTAQTGSSLTWRTRIANFQIPGCNSAAGTDLPQKEAGRESGLHK
jgi:hypothetical protein